MGDAGDLLRALRLFGKMRKAASLQHLSDWPVPVPTLVTYSTLMSRAVKLHKPQVALRLWKLKGPQIQPDTKAANILMNCYAKLADVDRAEALLYEMQNDGGLAPNLVTYNTMLHACQKAGALDTALMVLEDMQGSGIRADARTYTSLIATVARKPGQKRSGQNDPSLAFELLQQMKDANIRPNGMTYSALIDACGRCQRPDLALQGLRMMLRQKDDERKVVGAVHLPAEVSGWTAAINACGKAGRVKTAMRLFYSMPRFGCEPNTVTCGSLTDSLLRAGRTAETLDVLRYMKSRSIEPSEVMYTSLMSRAETLVQSQSSKRSMDDEESSDAANQVYTELMRSLMTSPAESTLMRVFLVFQEMKAVGAVPDRACYNALLRACAREGDVPRALQVLSQMKQADLVPNDTSWRQILRAAGQAQNSSLAESVWKQAIRVQPRKHVDEPLTRWVPSIDSFLAFVTAYLREAEGTMDVDRQRRLYHRAVLLYEGVLMGHEATGLDRISPNELLEDSRAMLVILQAAVALEEVSHDKAYAIRTAKSILELDCMRELPRLWGPTLRAVQRARLYPDDY